MTAVNLPSCTRCGLPGIGDVPVGMHACHFYKNRDELVRALVPYCIAGLRGNERCLLIAAPPLPADEALQELRAAWVGVDDAIRTGALRVLDFDQWYASAGQLHGLGVVQLWLEEEERALAEGYSGLRIAGNTSFLTPDDWATFVEYEEAVTARFHGRRIVALCSYALAHCNDDQMSEVIDAHHCAFEHANASWRVKPRADSDQMEAAHVPGPGDRGGAAEKDSNGASWIPAAETPSEVGSSKSYRCYFTNADDRIQFYEQLECGDDAAAALQAQELLAGSRFTSAEVWQGKRLVGKWGNTGTPQRR